MLLPLVLQLQPGVFLEVLPRLLPGVSSEPQRPLLAALASRPLLKIRSEPLLLQPEVFSELLPQLPPEGSSGLLPRFLPGVFSEHPRQRLALASLPQLKIRLEPRLPQPEVFSELLLQLLLEDFSAVLLRLLPGVSSEPQRPRLAALASLPQLKIRLEPRLPQPEVFSELLLQLLLEDFSAVLLRLLPGVSSEPQRPLLAALASRPLLKIRSEPRLLQPGDFSEVLLRLLSAVSSGHLQQQLAALDSRPQLLQPEVFSELLLHLLPGDFSELLHLHLQGVSSEPLRQRLAALASSLSNQVYSATYNNNHNSSSSNSGCSNRNSSSSGCSNHNSSNNR